MYNPVELCWSFRDCLDGHEDHRGQLGAMRKEENVLCTADESGSIQPITSLRTNIATNGVLDSTQS